eukprot:363403-Chlamydomonas_euryale.AAC.17
MEEDEEVQQRHTRVASPQRVPLVTLLRHALTRCPLACLHKSGHGGQDAPTTTTQRHLAVATVALAAAPAGRRSGACRGRPVRRASPAVAATRPHSSHQPRASDRPDTVGTSACGDRGRPMRRQRRRTRGSPGSGRVEGDPASPAAAAEAAVALAAITAAAAAAAEVLLRPSQPECASAEGAASSRAAGQFISHAAGGRHVRTPTRRERGWPSTWLKG